MVPINLDMKFERLETISLIHFPIPLKVSSMTLSEKLLIGRKEAQKAQEKLEKDHFVA